MLACVLCFGWWVAVLFFFFFSSRRRHTRWNCDWSSDVCSSDLAGASQRLTVVVGSAGAGKSVLLSSWAAARQPAVTSWLSCDEADADPVRFWAAFIEAPRLVAPGFGADAGEIGRAACRERG